MSNKNKKMRKEEAQAQQQQGAPKITRQDDKGLPGGGKGRVDITGKSEWTAPEGNYPPGEGYEESGRSGVISPERFTEKKGEKKAEKKEEKIAGAKA